MTTDFTPETPHKDYECTLHVRGTKAWFQTIRGLLDTAVPLAEIVAESMGLEPVENKTNN